MSALLLPHERSQLLRTYQYY